MKRYTVRIHTQETELSLDQIKHIVKKVFLLAHPPITFRMGRISRSEDASFVLVEIATEIKKHRLDQLFERMEQKENIQIDYVGWGWVLTDPVDKKRNNEFVSNPHLSIQTTQEETNKVYTYTGWQIVRFVASSLTILILLVGLAVITIFRDTSVYEFIDGYGFMSYLIFILFSLFLAFSEIHIFPMFYVSFIQCNDQEVRIKYWFFPKIKRLEWKDIEGLDISNRLYTIHSKSQQLKFQISALPGLKEVPVLVKTIIERASLHYVTDGIYRRFDAD